MKLSGGALKSCVAVWSLVALTACTPRPAVQLPPPELATCAPEPKAPDIPARDGSDETQLRRDMLTLDYVLALVGAGGDCRAKVSGLAKWRDSM